MQESKLKFKNRIRNARIRCSPPTVPHSPCVAGFHDREGQQYCQQCFLSLFASHCQGCSQPILENYISALSALWHPHCFVCRVSEGTLSQPLPTSPSHPPYLPTCPPPYLTSSLSSLPTSLPHRSKPHPNHLLLLPPGVLQPVCERQLLRARGPAAV